MLTKIIHWILGFIIFIGILTVIGAIGASDLEMIGVGELVKRGLAGSLVIIIGYTLLRLTGWEYVE